MKIDRRKDKKCSRCGETKSPKEYHKRKYYDRNGNTVIHCQSKCIECMNAQYEKVKKPVKLTTKRCHECFQFKPGSSYRKSMRGNVEFESNYCTECESKVKIVNHHEGYIRREHDTIKNPHYCAFIGNASYKEICKVFKIRME